MAQTESPPASECTEPAPECTEPSSEMRAKICEFVVDSAAMQGRRPKQEDRHVKVPDFSRAARALKMPIDHFEQPCAFFAVYDGHQGTLCADFIVKQFHLRLLKKLTVSDGSEAQTKRILCEVFEELDADFLAKYRTAPDGCTVVVAFLTGDQLFTAWVGDSRCLLCRRDRHGYPVTVAVTDDHRPSLPAEAMRVRNSGGQVIDVGDGALRVAHEGYVEKLRDIRRAQSQGLGTIGKEPVALAVSRALGDREFKSVTGRELLIATPDVSCVRLDTSCKFLALMCDGIPDVMRNEDIVQELLIKRDPSPAGDVRAACGALVQEAYKRGSGDNLTVILVRIVWQGHPDEAFATKPRETVDAESAAFVSKRRRLAANASISAQKVAAHEKAVAADEAAEQAVRKAASAVELAEAARRAALETPVQTGEKSVNKVADEKARSEAAAAAVAAEVLAAVKAQAPIKSDTQNTNDVEKTSHSGSEGPPAEGMSKPNNVKFTFV